MSLGWECMTTEEGLGLLPRPLHPLEVLLVEGSFQLLPELPLGFPRQEPLDEIGW